MYPILLVFSKAPRKQKNTKIYFKNLALVTIVPCSAKIAREYFRETSFAGKPFGRTYVTPAGFLG